MQAKHEEAPRAHRPPASSPVIPPAISIVVPCYNEEACLAELLPRLTSAAQRAADDRYEIILVNDGSKDRTWPLIVAASAADGHVIGVDLSKNHGHQLALTAGLSVAKGARVLIIDADLQDPPELLPEMMAKMDEGFDVVYGQRRAREAETAFKRLTAKMFYRLLSYLADVSIPLDTGDFRLISRRALDTLLTMPEQHRFIRGMVSWIGFPQAALRYDRARRFAGKTKYPLKKMVRFALDAITGFSTRPLRIASLLGLVLGVAGVILIAYILRAYFLGDVVPGWTSLMAIVVVLGSLQMVVLGVIGEYLGRLYMEAKRRPLFIIQDITARAPAKDGDSAPHNGGAATPASSFKKHADSQDSG